MKKSKQSKKRSDSLQVFIKKINLQELPIIRVLWKKWSFYKSVQEALKWHHKKHDSKEHQKTTLPKSEKIEFHCAWVTEAYTPSNIDTLITSLKKLDWDEPEDSMDTRSSLLEWLRENRSYGAGSSWMNGGLVLAHKDKVHFLGADIRRTNLPLGVDYARLSIRNITSSLTLVTMQFVFNDSTAHSLNELFNNSYKTKLIYSPSLLKSRRAKFVGVINQKMEAIEEKLDEIHSSLYQWFKDNLPGQYSLSNTKVLPTVDLITGQKYKQLRGKKSRLRDHYTDLLFGYGIETWKCKEDSNLELKLQWGNTEKPIASLFGNYAKLTQVTEGYGGKDRAALTSKLHMVFDANMGLWATHNLLLSLERQLSAIRDRASFRIKGTREALKNLDFIKHRFSSISVDARAISNDIAVFVKAKRRYSRDTIDFKPPHYFKDVFPSFLELLRQQDEMRAEQLIKLEPRVNEAVTSSGNLASAIANLRIQRNVFWLTVFVTILTIFSMLFSVLSIFKKDPSLQEIQQKLTYLVNLVETLLQKQ